MPQEQTQQPTEAEVQVDPKVEPDPTLSITVDQARKRARDLLRMKRINRLKNDLLEVTNEKESIFKLFSRKNRELAGLEYDLEHLDKEHPLYGDKKDDLKAQIKALKKENDRTGKQSLSYDDKIAEINEQITKWETGENKVDKEELYELADRIIKECHLCE